MGYSPWGHKEFKKTEVTYHASLNIHNIKVTTRMPRRQT